MIPIAKSERKKAKAKADTWFSIYIRLFYADDCGYVKCITCGKILDWKGKYHNDPNGATCGHFMKRDQEATRYTFENSAPQCVFCNNYKSGKQYEHSQWINRTFGNDKADELEWKSKTMCKRISQDYRMLADEFKVKAKELAEKKGLKL